MTSPDAICGESFTDRGRGKGFVLSAYRAASGPPVSRTGAAESKQVISNSVNAAGNGSMECQLLRMCQNVTHVYKQIVN
jgi:hypothetical protein